MIKDLSIFTKKGSDDYGWLGLFSRLTYHACIFYFLSVWLVKAGVERSTVINYLAGLALLTLLNFYGAQ